MKEISSKALEVNLAEYSVNVTVDQKYHVIREVMSKYEGLQKQLDTFLEELCHPRKNWQFIVHEFKTFALGYFYDLKTHEKGPEAVKVYLDVAIEAIERAEEYPVRTISFHNLYLLIQKFIKESGPDFQRFLPVINYGFDKLGKFSKNNISLVAMSYYRLNRLAREYARSAPPDADYLPLNSAVAHCLEYTLSYWLNEKDPLEWFKEEIGEELSEEVIAFFGPLSHRQLRTYEGQLRELKGGHVLGSEETLEALLQLPGYGEIVDLYRDLPDQLYRSAGDDKTRHRFKLVILFHTMNLSGLSIIHEDTLREISNDIEWIISHEDVSHIQKLLATAFNILKDSVETFPDSVLKSVFHIGRGVYETNESDLVYFFNEQVVKLGFQTPDFRGISEDWQVQSNSSHIQNIRTWMELISLNPKWSKKLLSSLVIHLSLNGVLIKDTDLFPRDITKFLNGEIAPVYNLVKQLMRLFPAYFNEIGAEGRLRDISTDIDEICRRKDILVHFLRKQTHVESSNRIITLLESIFSFWRTKSKEDLRTYLPPGIYDQVREEGPYVDGVSTIVNELFRKKGLHQITDLLLLEDDIAETLGDYSDDYRVDIQRVSMAVSLYKTLNEKYCISSCSVDSYLSEAESSVPLNINELKTILSREDRFHRLAGILGFLGKLKNIILSPEPFEIREDIYRKRHIAADIPSMYGSYREAKFDSLGLTFRLESIANTLFEEIIEDFDLSFLTHATFYRIYECLKLFNRALNIGGIPAKEFENQLDLLNKSLNIKFVTYTQYLDIFRGFTQVVRDIVSNYFNSVHAGNLQEIAEFVPVEKLLPRYQTKSEDRQELAHKLSEIFLRDTIAFSLGLQKLDLFLMRISHTLHDQAEKLPLDKHFLLITYNPRKIVTSLSEPAHDLFDSIHLGNKSMNIIKMIRLGLPVPPGFVVTTEVFRCRELIESYAPAKKNFREQIDREIMKLEQLTGRNYGSPENTLLVSVRSGAAVSQPGMLDSYLNVGMNEEIVAGMIRQGRKDWFAWDSYRRFLQSYGMSFGLERDSFDAIISEFKDSYNVPLKKELTSQQMKDLAMAYKVMIRTKGIDVEESPREQLYLAVQRVLNSWTSEKARTYRQIIGISDDWGTAVTVQSMVFGNISEQSGSGVLFTHSPKFSQDVIRPWGDYTTGNQGEDVVSGLVTTYPISNYQAEFERRPEELSLETRFPEIFNALRDYVKMLIYENQWAPQDIEFTFEGPERSDLYLLQTRNMEMREKKEEPTFEDASMLRENFIGHGIGVSGGALSGRVVFSLDDIRHWREVEPETPLILIRNDTVPDDIKEISAADGLLTARGGATSHASIVATRLEKTCIAGCRDLVCLEKDRIFVLKDKTIHAGEFISIDGSEGSVYYGKMKTRHGRG